MRFLYLAPALLLAACATAPQTNTTVSKPVAAPVSPREHHHNDLIGETANELVEHFGTPRLQVREGVGTKLQWRAGDCVLDAYLYPPESGQGLPRVSYVDARTRTGSSTNLSDCARDIEAR